MNAFTTVGFVYLSNTGFPQHLVLMQNIAGAVPGGKGAMPPPPPKMLTSPFGLLRYD